MRLFAFTTPIFRPFWDLLESWPTSNLSFVWRENKPKSAKNKQNQAVLSDLEIKIQKNRCSKSKNALILRWTNNDFERNSKLQFTSVWYNISNIQLWKGGNKCDISSIKTPRKIWTMLWKSNTWLWPKTKSALLEKKNFGEDAVA